MKSNEAAETPAAFFVGQSLSLQAHEGAMQALRLFDVRNPGTFRFCLALMVVVDHLFGVHLGLAAVYVFFILSGYWIHQIWEARYRQGAMPYAGFLASRLWRLMPVMATAMALAVLVNTVVTGQSIASLIAPFDGFELASHLLILGYASVDGPMLLRPAWTLDLELQFYIIAPLLCLLLRRMSMSAFLILGLGFAVLPTLIDTGIPVLRYLILFMLGMAASKFAWRPKARIITLSFVGAVAVFTALLVTGNSQVLFDDGSAPATYLLNWGLAMILAPVALATVHRRVAPLDSALGDMSYILYLMHWPLITLSAAVVGTEAAVSLMPVFVTMLAAVSYATWRYVDRPANRLRTRIVAGWQRSRTPPRPETSPPPHSFA